MDSWRHGYQPQYSGVQSPAWPAVNRSTYRLSESMASSPGGPIVLQTTIPNLPVIKPLANPFKSAGASTPRALLPRPDRTSKTQLNRPCLVCNKSGCQLKSHKQFAELAISRTRSRPSADLAKRVSAMPTVQTTQHIPELAVQYPVAMDEEKQQLLNLWSLEWSRVRRGPERHLFPSPWIDHVLPTAKSHAPLFQALLATSAAMWTMAHSTLNDSSVKHLQLADQILSQTCTSQAIAAGDECLLAALLITMIHQAQGDDRETDRHFARIVELVTLRGGPYYLRMSGVVADTLLYVDFLQAAILNCEPVWTLPLPALQIGIPPRLGAMFGDRSSTSFLSVEVLMAADSLCKTADIFEQSPESELTDTGGVNAFGYLSTISEYQLAHCNAVFHGSATWNECICLALLLFNHLALRNNGAFTAPMRRLENQLWQTIENTISRCGFRDVPPCLLLWLFTVGLSACTLVDSRHRPTAISKMRAAKITAAIHGWENFQRQVLDDYIWLRSAQEEIFRGVWAEVEGYRTS